MTFEIDGVPSREFIEARIEEITADLENPFLSPEQVFQLNHDLDVMERALKELYGEAS